MENNKNERLLGRRPESFHSSDNDSIASLDTTSSSESDEDDDAAAQVVPTAEKLAGPMSMTCRNVRVSWKPGNIVKENADILVSLTTGRLFEAFKNAGGPGFRIPEMSVKNPPSEILADESGNLPCEKVILTTCCKWDGGEGKAEKELRSIVQQCLLKAEQFNGGSIAFPIIGTGGHGFPKNTACQIMISEVINVTSGWGTSSLNEICFVVFDEDEQLINLFQQEFISAIECLNVFKNVSVCVLQGDLVQEQSDAIVNMNSIGMDMQKAGALSKAVSAAAGPSVQVECSSLGKQSPGSVVVTGAGNLEAKHIIHVIPGKADVGHIQNCIEECLRVADRNGFESISMPAFGTGGLKMSYDDSAQATFQAIENVCPNFQNLKHIRIVLFKGLGFEYMVSIFQQAQQQYLAGLPRSTAPKAETPEAPTASKLETSGSREDFCETNPSAMIELGFRNPASFHIPILGIHSKTKAADPTNHPMASSQADSPKGSLISTKFQKTEVAMDKDVLSTHDERIRKFLDDNSVETIIFTCPDVGVRRYILEYRKEDLLKMENDYSVKIKPGKSAKALLISGTKIGIACVQEALHILTGSVAMNEMEAQQPGLHKFFTSGRGDRLVKSVEHKHQCVIEKNAESLVPVFASEKDVEADSTVQTSSSASKSADSGSMACGNVRISWKQGNIVAEQADVLVGSTTGQLSKVFQTVGGPPLQQTFKQVQVHSGTVTVTDSGYLPCKHVIVTSCCEWVGKKGAAEKELRSIVQQCLQQALQMNTTSIAFPIIGTGGLGFPNDIACQIMISEVISVIKGWETPCLDDIRFIVYAQDAQLIKAFQKEFALASSQLSAHAHKGEGFVSLAKQEYLSSRSPDTTTTTAFGNVSVQVLQGDLVQETTDAIVNINSIGMDMQKAGALSKAVSAAAGPSVQAECSRLGKRTPGSAEVTGAGNLKVKFVIHMIPGKADVEHIQSCIEKCLYTADLYTFRSISMPAFGTGAYGMSAADSAKSTFQALAKVCPTLKYVREIRIVIFQANLISAFQQKKRQYETGTATEMKPPELPKPDKMAKSREHCFEDIDLLETISFCFFGKSKDSFDKAKAELAKGLKEACSTQTIENKDTSKLSEQQRQKLRTKASHTGVIIKFLDGTSQRIEVQGDPEDVSAMVNYVWEEIYSKNEEELAERQNENAEVIYETVKWRFDVDGKKVGFGKKVNADIEKARVRKDHQVTVEVEGKKCVIDFATSTGTDLSSGRTFRVTRATVKGDIEDDTTREWSPMPIDSSGMEATVHLVTLTNSSAEYQKVLNLFQSTGGTGYIVKIQRIQNPHLYQQYMVRKQKMDKDNPGMNNERHLFHGTPAKNLKDINAKGFNRSFCGVNNTLYGDGVYFATNASYSESYTRPNANEKRHMYIARVLIGRYTKGQKGMKVPPKDPNRPGMSFDSVANHYYRDSKNASIFVVFYDFQCYPEYLITFQ